ncbi:solute carrier family 15 member 1 [Pimephales promelas]|uniref:solute carrier family 15 member 1 n=1 Tax=Pimephales promelas TaxID=90988 RepID=UPI0019556975|nr:solute carrier family 15 member 1 [Pimephales promelas]KAG1941263.1 solute carrier family [Pimephales promelas]
MTDGKMDETKKKRKKTAECCGYPISIFFIVVNEFCERFSYYGMRAVLVLYFRYFLLWDDDLATSVYHAFVALCYLTPIMGAIIADSWLGKFRTIIYLSVVYAVGQVVMAVSTIHDITDADRDGTPDNFTLHIALSMLGLILIALGTGGIKPCVAAFGGDQFQEHQSRQLNTFFSVFYLCINAGSLLSTLITPVLRAQECGIHTQQQCYPLAFGVPAALMVISLVVFIAGSGMYIKTDPEGNIIWAVCKCIGFAIRNRFRHRSSAHPKREHWMDWAEDKYDKLLIAQIKMVLKVLFLYIPLPMFWTLFDQKGSRWTLQATTMSGDFGAFILQPDQMQTVNPILILTLVPIMDRVIFPLIKKCGLDFSPLKRMTVGMLFAASAFVCAALVQIEIDKTLPNFPSSSESQLKVVNMYNSSVNVTISPKDTLLIDSLESSAGYVTLDHQDITVSLNTSPVTTKAFSLIKGGRQTLVIPSDPSIMYLQEDLKSKPREGKNAIRFVNGWTADLNITTFSSELEPSVTSNYSLVNQGTRKFVLSNGAQSCEFSQKFGFGSSYTFLVPSTLFSTDCKSIKAVEDIQPNSVHMALQIPQYFLITTGEVMFSVTGLQFSYSQAPKNMKSVLQAGWLCTNAVGNIIVLIVAELGKLPKQWAEYVLFASLLVAVSIIFSFMAYFYTYIDPAEIEAQIRREQGLEPEEEKKETLEMEDKDKEQKNEQELKHTKL